MIENKKKALDVLADKLILKSSNIAIKEKFKVNNHVIAHRMKDLVAGELDPQNLFKLIPRKEVKFDQIHLNHIKNLFNQKDRCIITSN